MRHTKALAVIAGVLVSATLLGGTAHAGDIYKYVDDRGNTLYTDKPIPGAVLVTTGVQRPAEVSARTNAANQATTTAQLTASNQPFDLIRHLSIHRPAVRFVNSYVHSRVSPDTIQSRESLVKKGYR